MARHKKCAVPPCLVLAETAKHDRQAGFFRCRSRDQVERSASLILSAVPREAEEQARGSCAEPKLGAHLGWLFAGIERNIQCEFGGYGDFAFDAGFCCKSERTMVILV